MATQYQETGRFGEKSVVQRCSCPRCKRKKTLVRLPSNFKCADVICDFCGYLGQVKTATVRNIEKIPSQIRSAAWGPQEKRMIAGIYFSLFLVLKNEKNKNYAIHYLAADLQEPEMFMKRKELPKTAKRAGWQGFNYNFRNFESRFVCIFEGKKSD